MDTQENAPVEGVVAATPERLTIAEAATLTGVTRQAIYVAIKLKKLTAEKSTSRWAIDQEALKAYRAGRYSRARSTFQGTLLFDNEKGFYSVSQTAKMLNVPVQKIYYAMRSEHLKSLRKGTAWVIHIDDITSYRESYLEPRKRPVQSAPSAA